ncbi:hypothetical protein D3C81_985380 [compost metagenome]
MDAIQPIGPGDGAIPGLVFQQHHQIDLCPDIPGLIARAIAEQRHHAREECRRVLVEPSLGVDVGAHQEVLPAGRKSLAPYGIRVGDIGRGELALIAAGDGLGRSPAGRQVVEPDRGDRRRRRGRHPQAIVGGLGVSRRGIGRQAVAVPDVEIGGALGME